MDQTISATEASEFDIIKVQNVQNINIDVTDTVGNAGCVLQCCWARSTV